jgi:hypothetical protein
MSNYALRIRNETEGSKEFLELKEAKINANPKLTKMKNTCSNACL